MAFHKFRIAFRTSIKRKLLEIAERRANGIQSEFPYLGSSISETMPSHSELPTVRAIIILERADGKKATRSLPY
jgi:hypothetical protein